MPELKSGMVLKLKGQPDILGLVVGESVMYMKYIQLSFKTYPDWIVDGYDHVNTVIPKLEEIFYALSDEGYPVVRGAMFTRIYNDKKMKPIWRASGV